MAKAPGSMFPWDKDNEEQQKLVCRTGYKELLQQNRVTLRDSLHLSDVWAHLRQLGVVDRIKEQDLKFNAPEYQVVERLLDLIETGPAWWFHALLRACALTNQDYLIIVLSLDPQVYCMERLPPAVEQQTELSCMEHKGREYTVYTQQAKNIQEANFSQHTSIEPQLLNAIRDHCKSICHNLMKRNLFDLDDHPAAEIFDSSKCFIEAQAQISGEDRTMTEVKENEILKPLQMPDNKVKSNGSQIKSEHASAPNKIEYEDLPRAGRLFGAPGAGKTTFLRHLAYTWSTEFLELSQKCVSIDINCETTTTIVYVPARSIEETIEKSIRKNLGCKEKDVDLLMKHVKDGEGTAILFDGIDEVRNKATIEMLRRYVHQRKMQGGPQIIISSRTDQCPIVSSDFDRFLVLPGFTTSQGMEYIHKYLDTHPSTHVTSQKVLSYVQKHLDKLKEVLCNPLRLHIFSALTAKGLLQLQDDNVFNAANLFEPLENFLVKRESERLGEDVTEEHSQSFYRMCLFAMMTGLREIPGHLFDKFQIVKSYHVFFEKVNRLDRNAAYVTYYSFKHEMFFEYFSSRYIEKIPMHQLNAVLLPLCSEKPLQNVQKIVIELILRMDRDTNKLIQQMVRAILILQHDNTEPYEDWTKSNLMDLAKKVKETILLEEILMSGEVEDQKVQDIWNMINLAFDQKADNLRSSSWYNALTKNGIIRHVVDCLQICSTEQREIIISNTIHKLLPSIDLSFIGQVWTTYPVGRDRRGIVRNESDGRLTLMAERVEDCLELLQAHFADRLPVQSVRMKIHVNRQRYNDLWGKWPVRSLPQGTWSRTLHSIAEHITLEWLTIILPSDCSLTGLLGCLVETPVNLIYKDRIRVYGGSITQAELERFIHQVQQMDIKVQLWDTHTVLADSWKSARLRLDSFYQACYSSGDRILCGPELWTEAGERVSWLDLKECDEKN